MNRRRFLFLSMSPIAGAMSCKLFARPMDDDIPLNGEWPGKGGGGESYNSFGGNSRTIVMAMISGSTIYISGAGCGSDVTVHISGLGFTYHNIYATSEANNIMIGLSSAPSGVYSLHITNLLGGYLDGTFNL